MCASSSLVISTRFLKPETRKRGNLTVNLRCSRELRDDQSRRAASLLLAFVREEVGRAPGFAGSFWKTRQPGLK